MQRTKARQLKAGSNQFLNRNIDDVGQILHPRRRKSDGGSEQSLSRFVEASYTKVLADHRDMTSPRTRLVVLGQRVGNDQHPSVMPDMFNNTPGHVLERDEVAQPLKSFQQNQKAQLRGLSLGDTGGEIAQPEWAYKDRPIHAG